MLYSISGSQGTGKSTLLNALGYPTIERKTSRSVLSDWGVTLSEVNNNRPLTIKFQDEILKRKIEDEADAAASSDIYFTERTFADLFVYALVAIGKDNEYSDWLDSYYERCLDAQRDSYQNVFYLTAGHFKPVDDGVRAINQHYSRMVDVMMYEYTTKMTPSVVLVQPSNLDLRVAMVQDHIIGHKNSEQIAQNQQFATI